MIRTRQPPFPHRCAALLRLSLLSLLSFLFFCTSSPGVSVAPADGIRPGPFPEMLSPANLALPFRLFPPPRSRQQINCHILAHFETRGRRAAKSAPFPAAPPTIPNAADPPSAGPPTCCFSPGLFTHFLRIGRRVSPPPFFPLPPPSFPHGVAVILVCGSVPLGFNLQLGK